MAGKKEKADKRNLLIGAGIMLLAIASFLYFKPKEKKEASTVNPEEIIVQEKGAVKKTGDETQPLSQEEIEKIKKEVDSVLDAGGQTAELKGVDNQFVSGKAQKAFSDGKFYYKITVSGLEPLEKGFYYEGWLKKDDKYFSTGRLELDNQGNGVLYYTASVDKSDYNKAAVTLEPEDGNAAPASPVLEGEFSGLNI